MKQKLQQVLSEICNNSDKRVYGKYWNKRFSDVNKYLKTTDKEGYFTIKYYNSNGDKDIETAKSKTDKGKKDLVFDNLFFDFDDYDNITNSLNDCIKVAKIFDSKGLDVLANFSGSKGGHIHLLFNPIELDNPQEVLEEFSKQVEKSYKVNLDDNVYTKLNGLKRIPCSKHNKSGDYSHFIDFNDNNCINTILNIKEYAPDELIDNKTKYFIPDIPDRDKNTEIISPVLKAIDGIINEEKVNKKNNINTDNIVYELNPDVNLFDDKGEFINRFSKLYFVGNRWEIGHSITFMFRRIGLSSDDVIAFFKQLTPDDDMKEVHNFVNWIYGMDMKGKFAGFTYFKNRVIKSIKNKQCDVPEYEVSNYINYFKSVFYPDNSIYKIPPELIKKGYKYDDTGLYCPFNTKPAYYLKISRGYNKYKYCIAYEKKVNHESSFEIRSKIIESENCILSLPNTFNSRLGMGAGIINKRYHKGNAVFTLTDKKNDIKGTIVERMEDIPIDLVNIPHFEQITGDFKEFANIQKDKENEKIIDKIEWRKNPDFNENTANKIKLEIEEQGWNIFIDDKISKFMLGDTRNVKRKHLGTVSIMRGDGGYFISTVAKAGRGKSLEDKTVKYMIPDEYIMRRNDFTFASFLRNAKVSPEFYNRLIIDLADLGNKEAYDRVKDVFGAVKSAITEGEYIKELTDREINDNGFINTVFELIFESIGLMYQSTKSYTIANDNGDGGDGQEESRSIQSSPDTSISDDKIMSFISQLEIPNSPETLARNKAKEDLKDYHQYLLSLVNDTDVIVNPYDSVFQKIVANDEDNKIRNYEQARNLFLTYCRITKHECDVINGIYVSSEKQLTDFLENIILDDVISPKLTNFIHMLLGVKEIKPDGTFVYKQNKISLTPVTDEDLIRIQNDVLEKMCTDDVISITGAETFTDDKGNTALYYVDRVMDTINEYDKYITFEDMDKADELKAIKWLLRDYKIKGKVESRFFRVSDVRTHYNNNKAYKDVENDINVVITKLHRLGFIRYLDYSDGRNKNIYYLTPKCLKVGLPIDISDEDRENREKVLIKNGVISGE